jgi:hypothetical protein
MYAPEFNSHSQSLLLEVNAPAAAAAQPNVNAKADALPGIAKQTGFERAEDEIEWGKESNGLVANLRAAKKIFAAGEPMEFEIRLKNVSNKELPVWGSRGQLSPIPWVFRFGDWEWRPGQPSLISTPLKPGETRTATVSVRAAQTPSFRLITEEAAKPARLPAGVYLVQAANEHVFGREHNRFVETNAIEIRVGNVTEQ